MILVMMRDEGVHVTESITDQGENGQRSAEAREINGRDYIGRRYARYDRTEEKLKASVSSR